jgi:hypothetical protein
MVLPVDLRSIDRASFWYTPNMATEMQSPDSPRNADHLCVLVHGTKLLQLHPLAGHTDNNGQVSGAIQYAHPCEKVESFPADKIPRIT